jgi:CRP-like cAMP-binding protein
LLDVIEAHLLRLRARDDISAEEEQAIRDAVLETKVIAADRTFIHAEQELSTSTLLIEGLMCRYKDLRNGQRQISELHVAGDFVDLHSFTLKKLDHNIMALTPCRIAVVPHDRLRKITEQFPHLTRVYWFSTNLDAAIHREWQLSLGRRPAVARLAHLFCELFVRLSIVKLTNGDSYALPLTQTDLAECLGLTSVHVNRTLRELRELGLVEFRSNRVNITDFEGLKRIAEFNPSYLYLEPRAR